MLDPLPPLSLVDRDASARDSSDAEISAWEQWRECAGHCVSRVLVPVVLGGSRLTYKVVGGPAGASWAKGRRALGQVREAVRPMRRVRLIPIVDASAAPERVPVLSGHFDPAWSPREPRSPFSNAREPLRLTLHAAGLGQRVPAATLDLLQQLHRGSHVETIASGDLWPDYPDLRIVVPTLDLEPGTLDLDRRMQGVAVPTIYVGTGWRAAAVELPRWDFFRARARARAASDGEAGELLEGYCALLCHVASGGHVFVTRSALVFREEDEPLWRGIRMRGPSEAIALAGVLMRRGDHVEREFGIGAPTKAGDGFSAYLELAQDFLWVLDQLPTRTVSGRAVGDLTLPSHDRILNMLVQRDEVAISAVVPDSMRTTLPSLWALSGVAVAAFGLFECFGALGACLLELETLDYGSLVGFRKRLRSGGGHEPLLAQLEAPRLCQLHKMIRTLRHPAAHAGSYDVAHTGTIAGPAVARIPLLPKQVEAIMQVRRARREDPRLWGLTAEGAELADPWRLADRLVKATLEVWLEVVASLSASLGRDIRLESSKCNVLNRTTEVERALLGGFGDSQSFCRLVGSDPVVPSGDVS